MRRHPVYVDEEGRVGCLRSRDRVAQGRSGARVSRNNLTQGAAMLSSRYVLFPLALVSALAVGCAGETNADADANDGADADGETDSTADELRARLARKYGGTHLELNLTATGGSLSFDCATGSLAAPLRLDSNGRFSVAGTILRGSGVQRPPWMPPIAPVAVTFKGRVTGSTMSIGYASGGAPVGETYSLKANKEGTLYRCM
jgi:hypothetical protein